MINPMQMFNGNGNPLGQIQNNPLFQRAQQMAAGKSPQELQQIAKNLCQQRGINMDEAYQQFRQMFGR
jgi:hypothetical protein